MDEAQRQAQAMVGLLSQHALRVLDTHALALRQIDYRIEGLDWQAITISREIHDYLLSLSRDLRTPNALFVTDPTGRLRATNEAFPAPDLDLSDREYFDAQRKRDAGVFFSTPYERRIGDRSWAFAVSLRRSAGSGSFNGTIH
ncbi:MAG TPA: hypothetical protein VFO36_06555, partial [Nitrospiraceae bacterium]|nr:hypothetical protein [Nitrospiraceae bacterium]